MQYHEMLIFIHRIFVSKRHLATQSLQSGSFCSPFHTCLDSAFAIARLLSMYQGFYGLRHIHVQAVGITFSAALLLLSGTLKSQRPSTRAAISHNLGICCDALAEMGEFHENAARALDLLLNIKRSWQAHLVQSS